MKKILNFFLKKIQISRKAKEANHPVQSNRTQEQPPLLEYLPLTAI